MTTPTNASALLRVDNDAGGHTFNAGFTFTAGRDAVLKLTHYAAGASAINSVTIGGTAATLDVQLNKFSGDSFSARIYRASNMAGGTANVVIGVSGGTDHYISGDVEEYDETLTPNAGTANTATGTSATPTVATAGATSVANTMVYAVACPVSGITNNNLSGPTSWTATFTEQDSSNHVAGRAARIEEVTTGTKTATFGMTSNSWGAVIVAYEISAGGGGGARVADLVGGKLQRGGLLIGGSLIR